jgi:PKD repeat protein|tara:strand:- start:412 stop:894 length:483 start_codon:yes stop_codon:yes gene_type:complete
VTVIIAPTVALTVPSPVTEGEGATFTLSVTAGATPIRTMTIDFGDGSEQSLGALAGTGTVAHVYRRDSTYVVTVTATDTGGDSTTVTSTVVVAEEEVTPLSLTLTSDLTSGTGTAPVNVTFTAAVTPTTANIVRYDWTFGDGTSVTTSGAVTSHVYGPRM